MTIYVTNYTDPVPPKAIRINTTSRSDNWSRELSPFFLGPVHLYGGQMSRNVECAYQFCKCYPQFIDGNGDPTPEYFKWAKAGWDSERAIRYPMGKGAKPLYSYWNGEKLGYIEARKRIYIPLYATCVVKTAAYKMLQEMIQLSSRDIYLADFDGYNHKALNMTYDDVVHCETKTMGHAFVIAMLLEGAIEVKNELRIQRNNYNAIKIHSKMPDMSYKLCHMELQARRSNHWWRNGCI